MTTRQQEWVKGEPVDCYCLKQETNSNLYLDNGGCFLANGIEQ